MCDKERGIAARLETETSRLATTSAERDRTRDEMKKLEATCAELRAQLSRATAAPKTDDELRAENAKLAAQLLSASSTSDDAAQLRDLERKFLEAQATWRRERESLRAELDALRRSNEASQRSAPLVNGASRLFFHVEAACDPRDLQGAAAETSQTCRSVERRRWREFVG